MCKTVSRWRHAHSRIVAGYERIPQATADDWGDVEAWVVGSAKQVHRRLDAEERDGGHPSW